MRQVDLPIVMDLLLKAKHNTVWKALTHLPSMRQWYFSQLKSFKAEMGFTTIFLVDSDQGSFTHQWVITELIPEERIAYTWEFAEYTGKSITVFELIKEGDKTRLKFKAEVLESFPSNIPAFKRESALQAWKYFLEERLKPFVETEEN